MRNALSTPWFFRVIPKHATSLITIKGELYGYVENIILPALWCGLPSGKPHAQLQVYGLVYFLDLLEVGDPQADVFDFRADFYETGLDPVAAT